MFRSGQARFDTKAHPNRACPRRAACLQPGWAACLQPRRAALLKPCRCLNNAFELIMFPFTHLLGRAISTDGHDVRPSSKLDKTSTDDANRRAPPMSIDKAYTKSHIKGLWRNGSASDSRSEGWEFESLWPHFLATCCGIMSWHCRRARDVQLPHSCTLWSYGLMDKALVFGTKDSRFES